MATKITLEYGVPERYPPRDGSGVITEIQKKFHLITGNLLSRTRSEATQIRPRLRELDLRGGRGPWWGPGGEETSKTSPGQYRRYGVPERYPEMEHREYDTKRTGEYWITETVHE